jgi:hypothetical protein
MRLSIASPARGLVPILLLLSGRRGVVLRGSSSLHWRRCTSPCIGLGSISEHCRVVSGNHSLFTLWRLYPIAFIGFVLLWRRRPLEVDLRTSWCLGIKLSLRAAMAVVRILLRVVYVCFLVALLTWMKVSIGNLL